MPLFSIPFPMISPILVEVGPFALRWYALAYVAGLIAAWWLGKRLAEDDALWGARIHPRPIDVDDLVVYAALGIVGGGRLVYVLFYNPKVYLANPIKILAPLAWRHVLPWRADRGAMLAMAVHRPLAQPPMPALFDTMAPVAPIGLFLGRLVKFVNGELYGRPTDVPWAMVFPRDEPLQLPRHPSQLYEAGLEGVMLFTVPHARGAAAAGSAAPGLTVRASSASASRSPASLSNSCARQTPQLGYLYGGWLTMGMVLSLAR